LRFARALFFAFERPHGSRKKTNAHEQTLALVDTIAFDKTGTLTNGAFGVVAVHAHGGAGEELLLPYAAHAEA